MEPTQPARIDWASLIFVLVIVVFLRFAPVLRDWVQGTGGSVVVASLR